MERPRFFRQGGIRLIESVYKLSADEHSLSTINNLTAHLDSNPKLNLTVYFNHISYDDPVFILWFNAKYIDPTGKRKIILPGSFSHTAFEKKPHFAVLSRLGRLFFDYDLIRIVQSYQVESEKYDYTAPDAWKTYKTLVRQVKDTVQNSPKPITLLLSPEGHRSEDGALKQGEKGIVRLGQILSPNVYLPVGIIYQQQYKRDMVNFLNRVNLTVGKPIFSPDKSQKPSYEELMYRLASNLPEEMRGAWTR